MLLNSYRTVLASTVFSPVWVSIRTVQYMRRSRFISAAPLYGTVATHRFIEIAVAGSREKVGGVEMAHEIRRVRVDRVSAWVRLKLSSFQLLRG
jgi:hypothetical protein